MLSAAWRVLNERRLQTSMHDQTLHSCTCKAKRLFDQVLCDRLPALQCRRHSPDHKRARRSCSPVCLIKESDEQRNIEDQCIYLQAAAAAHHMQPSTCSTESFPPTQSLFCQHEVLSQLAVGRQQFDGLQLWPCSLSQVLCLQSFWVMQVSSACVADTSHGYARTVLRSSWPCLDWASLEVFYVPDLLAPELRMIQRQVADEEEFPLSACAQATSNSIAGAAWACKPWKEGTALVLYEQGTYQYDCRKVPQPSWQALQTPIMLCCFISMQTCIMASCFQTTHCQS